MDKKIASVLAYSSQFLIRKVMSQKHQLLVRILQIVLNYRARDLGRLIGVDYAEGFTSERYVLVDNLSKLI